MKYRISIRKIHRDQNLNQEVILSWQKKLNLVQKQELHLKLV